MARVYAYTRSVDATIAEGRCNKSQFHLEDVTLNRIKEEPCNENYENTSTSSNDESKEDKSNNMFENNYNNKKTICCPTKRESENNVSYQIPENKYDNTNTVCCSSQKRKSRKRKLSERHSLEGNDDWKNMKALQENDNNMKSYKRQRNVATSEQIRKGLNTKNQTTVRCKICFSKFNSLHGLHFHEILYERKKQTFMSGKDKSFGKGRLSCNFCAKRFKNKNRIQNHLFHLHTTELDIDGKKNSLSNESRNSPSCTPKKQIMRQTTLFEYMFSPEKSERLEITNNPTNSDGHSQTVIKQEIDLNDNEPDLSADTSLAGTFLQSEVPNQTRMPNQPFVKIYIHSTMIKELLGIDQNDCTTSSKNNSKNNNNSDTIYSVRSLNSSNELNNEDLTTVVNKIKQESIGKKLKDRDLLSICKKCSVPLVRCDNQLVTKLTMQRSTPSAQILEQNDSTSSKRKRQRSKNMNMAITPILDTQINSIPKDFSSTNSTPKGILSSSTRSKATMPNLYVKNNLSKQLAKRRSPLEKISPNVEKETSPKQKNAIDSSESSSSEKELDLTNVGSTRPAIELKLRELKVSLVKLPNIKKEFDHSNIFYCEICKLPFNSEKRKDRHIRKFHTAYISSICTAQCSSKRYMLKHYLQEHCIWGSKRCCVCRQFFRSRLSLQRHLLLHCIKVTISENERRPNKIARCHAVSKMRKRLQAVKRKEIADVGQENVNANNVENVTSLADIRKANRKAKMTYYEQQRCQMNEATLEMQSSFDSNVIYVSSNNDCEVAELEKELVLDPLYVMNDSTIIENETRTALTPNLNTMPLNVSNSNKTVSILPNIGGNTKQRYPCSICGKQFQKIEGLWQHKRTYTQSLQNFCTTCGLCFSNRKILRNHINCTHDVYLSNFFKYHCQFCNQGFRAEPNLRIHELHYHAAVETTGKEKVAELFQVSNVENNLNTTETMCNVCGRNFNSYERYQLHCMYYHKGHVFTCQFCNQIFQGLYMLHHHNKLHHYPESTKLSYTYHCPICYEGFTIETHFHGHMAHVHSSKEPTLSPLNQTSPSSKKSYICSKCRLEFSTITELMAHVEHYTDGGNYQCQQCHRKCCTLAVLNEHINLSHGDRLRNDYKCDICNEVLLSSTSFLCHRKHAHENLESPADFTFTCRTSDPSKGEIHDKVLPVITEPENESATQRQPQVCVNASTSSASMWGKCNISCPICGITFDTEHYLKQHLTEYLDVGDYKCEKCNRRFANYEFLMKHMANHTKPGVPLTKYHCNVCNENFQSSIVYESHIAHLHASIIVTDTS